MDNQKTQNNTTAPAAVNAVPKRRAWVVVVSSVLITLILAASAFGAYIAYSNTLKEREIKELNNTIDSLKKDDKASSSNTTPTKSSILAIDPNSVVDQTFEDKDMGLTFMHNRNVEVKTTKTKEKGGCCGNNDLEWTLTRVNVSDNWGNTIEFSHGQTIIACNSEYKTQDVLNRSELAVRTAYGDIMYVYDGNIIGEEFTRSERTSGENICIPYAVDGVIAKITIRDEAKLGLDLESVIRSIKQI